MLFQSKEVNIKGTKELLGRICQASWCVSTGKLIKDPSACFLLSYIISHIYGDGKWGQQPLSEGLQPLYHIEGRMCQDLLFKI